MAICPTCQKTWKGISAQAITCPDCISAVLAASGAPDAQLGDILKLYPDATTWVMKDPEGVMRRIRVVDMTDSHLWRWIRYFRKKWRDTRGFKGPDPELDTLIRGEMITAPAIYAEASKRNVIPGLAPPAPAQAPVVVPTQTEPGQPGERRITLDEE